MRKKYINMGTENSELFKIDSELTKAHTFITGQSGSGKTFLLSRYIEEILLKNYANVVLFDYNYEFAKFNECDSSTFTEVYNQHICPEDEEAKFRKKWEALERKKCFSILKSNEIKVLFEDIDHDRLMQLFNINSVEQPGAYLIARYLKEQTGISSIKQLQDFMDKIARWSEGRLKSKESLDQRVISEIKNHTTRTDYTRIINEINNLNRQNNIVFKNDNSGVVLNADYMKNLYIFRRFTALDLLTFSYDESKVRDFITLHVLKSLWENAKDNFRAWKESRIAELRTIFIVIDEAHNIAPNFLSDGHSMKSEIVDIIETIAAEGRKFGLFLILVSQRPDKINSNVFSECGNFFVMRSTPVTAKYMGKNLELNDDSEIEKIKDYDTGKTFCYGKLTDYDIRTFQCNIKRTCK